MAAIAVGSAATNRGSSITLFTVQGGTYTTVIDYNNAADGTGTISTVKAWWNTAVGSNEARAGTFTDNGGGSFTCHAGQSLGVVASGSEQTYTGLSIAITTGEFIGCDCIVGGTFFYIETDTSGGSGLYYASGQLCDPTDVATYTLQAGDIVSINGTGATSGGGGWTNIAKVNGVAAAAFAKVNGVAVADIAKFNGVAV